jgi:hypothetical protein
MGRWLEQVRNKHTRATKKPWSGGHRNNEQQPPTTNHHHQKNNVPLPGKEAVYLHFDVSLRALYPATPSSPVAVKTLTPCAPNFMLSVAK